ncbi:MAG: PDZ domain-containing protein [Caulobacteraceae bacterium]
MLVTKVDGLASQVGLQPGDIVRAVNDRPIQTTGQLQGALAQAGGAWRITVLRKGREITATFRL